ncbi:MAG: ABC transporter substrate-binding protein, partial [Chloroflexota bacterium]
AATSASGSGSASGGGSFNWKQFSGQSIVLLTEQHPWTKAIEPYFPDFEKLTGIKVNSEVLSEQQQRQKSLITLQAKSPAFDVFMSLKSFEGLLYDKAGYYAPLDGYLSNPKLTSSSYNVKDIQSGPMKGENIGGKQVGMPMIVEGPVIFYRTDLFKQAGVQPPKTIDELVAAAAALKKKLPAQVTPITLRGLPVPVAYDLGGFLHNEGGHWLNKQGTSNLSSPANVKGIQIYADLGSKYGPPGVVTYSFPQSSALFAEGRAAMMVESSNELSSVIDPKKSTVVGKVGVLSFPTGPGGDHPTVLQWGISISEFSQKKEPSWLFVQWATSPDMEEKLALKGIASPRASSWESAAFQKSLSDPTRKQWAAAVQHTIAHGNPNVGPQVEKQPQVRQIIG